MNHKTNLLASIGLAIGAVFGLSGMFFTAPTTQLVLFVISGIGLTMGMVLLSIKFIRENKDAPAAGFLLFAIGEAISTGGAAADAQTAESTFACCMLFYVVGLVLICTPKQFPAWVRIAGLASAVPFFLAAARKYLGYGLDSADTLPGIGYGLLILTIIGWIVALLRERGPLESR
jgi:hypothetical protein